MLRLATQLFEDVWNGRRAHTNNPLVRSEQQPRIILAFRSPTSTGQVARSAGSIAFNRQQFGNDIGNISPIWRQCTASRGAQGRCRLQPLTVEECKLPILLKTCIERVGCGQYRREDGPYGPGSARLQMRRGTVTASKSDVQRHLRQLCDAGSAIGLTDRQLLDRFATAGRRVEDKSAEAAFEAILARHGSTVLTVCRQVLGDAHAAEDAFQATFLVLVRRAGSLRVRDPGSLGPWLYEVAYRTALKVRQGNARRRAREHRAAVPEARAGQTGVAAEREDLGAALHDEVHRLPAKYRAPVVLCYFEGRTHDEAAAALHWPVGTVRSYLSRGRDLLRPRLARRGLAPAGLIGASRLEPFARAEISAPLLNAIIGCAIKGTPAAVDVAALADRVLSSVLLARAKLTAIALCVVLTAAGLGLVLRGAPASQPPGRPGSAPAPAGANRPRSTPVDRFGDPMPKHARARMGTVRFNEGAAVPQVIYASDGKSLFTAGWQRGVHIWDIASGRIVRQIGHDGDDDYEIALSPDGRTLAILCNGQRLLFWDVSAGRERRLWHLPKEGRSSRPKFSPDGLTLATVFVTKDPAERNGEVSQSIDLRDMSAPIERRRRIEKVSTFLQDFQFSPDGKTLATATYSNQRAQDSTQLWDVASGKERFRFPIKIFGVISVAFSPDGKRLFAGATDQTIRVYDLGAGKEMTPPLNHEHALTSLPNGRVPAEAGGYFRTMDHLTFSPDGSILAAAGRWTDYTGTHPGFLPEIILWDVARGSVLRYFPAQEELILSLSFAPDGKTIASTGRDPVVRLWDVATGREASLQAGHRSGIEVLAVSPVDATVFTGSADGTVRQWDSTTGREIGIVADFPDEVTELAIAPDGRTLLVGDGGSLLLWSVAERRQIRLFPRAGILNSYDVRHGAFSPDGKMIASDLGVFDVGSGKVLATFRDRKFAGEHLATYVPMFFSHDGQQIITAEAEGARIWDIATSREVRWAVQSRFQLDGVNVAGQMARTMLPAAISPDGRCLATSGSIYFNGWVKERFDPAIRIWNLATGQEVVTFEGHGEPVRDLAFSPDGRLLASCSGDWRHTKDKSVRVWDAGTGRELRRFSGHLGVVNAIAFTPDGRSLISGSSDATALVWDVSDLNGNVNNR
jgi:RNA polymerase sigma factor (sigma-70 family)